MFYKASEGWGSTRGPTADGKLASSSQLHVCSSRVLFQNQPNVFRDTTSINTLAKKTMGLLASTFFYHWLEALEF